MENINGVPRYMPNQQAIKIDQRYKFVNILKLAMRMNLWEWIYENELITKKDIYKRKIISSF